MRAYELHALPTGVAFAVRGVASSAGEGLSGEGCVETTPLSWPQVVVSDDQYYLGLQRRELRRTTWSDFLMWMRGQPCPPIGVLPPVMLVHRSMASP